MLGKFISTVATYFTVVAGCNVTTWCSGDKEWYLQQLLKIPAPKFYNNTVYIFASPGSLGSLEVLEVPSPDDNIFFNVEIFYQIFRSKSSSQTATETVSTFYPSDQLTFDISPHLVPTNPAAFTRCTVYFVGLYYWQISWASIDLNNSSLQFLHRIVRFCWVTSTALHLSGAWCSWFVDSHEVFYSKMYH